MIDRRLQDRPVTPLPTTIYFLRMGAGRSRTTSTLDDGHKSALTHTDGAEQRWSFARMTLAGFVQTKGLGSALCPAIQRFSAA